MLSYFPKLGNLVIDYIFSKTSIFISKKRIMAPLLKCSIFIRLRQKKNLASN